MKENEKKFFLKVHSTEQGEIVAICDSGILGKKFESGELILDVSEKFFGGNAVNEKDVLAALKNENVFTANIVGNDAVEMLIKSELLDKNGVKEIANVRHAQIFKIKV